MVQNRADQRITKIMKNIKIAIILGTRPEIIKMSPVIKECKRLKLNYFIIHTGQHYSYDMDKVFFKELELMHPKYNLKVGSGSHGVQTGRMLAQIEKILIDEKPQIVLVQGDTNSVLAGALAASKLHIKVGHIEAGLRSHDRTMPEEINRILVDHISDFAFVPTLPAKNNLINEGIGKKNIYITGNSVVDSVYQNVKLAKKKSHVLKALKLNSQKYFLVTLHRAENVDDKTRLTSIINGLRLLSDYHRLPIIWPMHPRTQKMVQKFSLINLINKDKFIYIIEPVGFLDFIMLEANAGLIMTDSGGVQEEACILKIPCLTLRDNTERPESVDVGANVLVGTDSDKLFLASKKMTQKTASWSCPFGDGTAAEQIIKIILKNN